MLANLLKRFIPSRFWASMIVGRWVDYSRWQKINIIEQGFERNPVFHAACSKIARTIANLPIYVDYKTHSGRAQTYEHPLLAALDRNEPIEQFVERCALFYVVTGELYINKVMSETVKKPLGYIVMPSQHCNPISGDVFNPIRGFEYLERTRQEFKSDEVVYISNISLSEYFHGMAAGVPLAEVLDLHNSAITWNKNVAKNGGTPPMYAMADGISEEEAAKLKQKYRDINGGANNAGDLNVVPGELKLQTLAVRPNDAEWEKAVSMCSRIILMALGVPSELMNDAANKTYNNQMEANKAFYTQTCIPIAERIFTAISRDAKLYYADKPEIKIDKDKIEELTENRERTALVAQRLHQAGIIDENEAREMLDFAPRTDEINNQTTGASEDVQDDIKSTKLRSVTNGI